MTYNYICLSCNKMMVMETWSPKSCDCGGIFVSREAVEEAYGYLTSEQDVLPLTGAELARELERVGAVLKHKEPKAIVTDVQAGIDDEELLWLTIEFNHNPSGSHKFLVGKVDALPKLPEWLKEFTNDGAAGDVVGWVNPGPSIAQLYEDTPDWVNKIADYGEDKAKEEEKPKPGDCAGPHPKFGEPGWLRYIIYCSDEPAPDADIDVPWDYYEGC